MSPSFHLGMWLPSIKMTFLAFLRQLQSNDLSSDLWHKNASVIQIFQELSKQACTPCPFLIFLPLLLFGMHIMTGSLAAFLGHQGECQVIGMAEYGLEGVCALRTFFWLCLVLGLPRWLSGKESACQFRRHEFDLWIWKIPWRRKWQPTPAFLPGKFHGQRSLAGYSPWSCRRVRHNLAMKQ